MWWSIAKAVDRRSSIIDARKSSQHADCSEKEGEAPISEHDMGPVMGNYVMTKNNLFVQCAS